MNWISAFIHKYLSSLIISVFLFLLVDFFFGGSLLHYAQSISDVEKRYRISHSIYHHTLAPSYDGLGRWGENYRVCTNASGFKDRCDRVMLLNKTFDIAFIGDSFTEGIGLSYEDTFVGKIAAAFPDLRIANLGVGSYSPSVYLAKVRELLREGYSFKELVVYIDISDIQDEAIYYRFVDQSLTDLPSLPNDNESLIGRIKRKCQQLFPLSYQGLFEIRRRLSSDEKSPSLEDKNTFLQQDFERSAWTYNQKSLGYGEMGVSKAIEKNIQIMSKLYDLLQKHGIKLSVGVYPWPAQLLYDQQQSLHVDIWKNFCKDKCNHFYDSYPSFFAFVKKEGANRAIEKLFINGDIHHNPLGAALIANDYIRAQRRR